jgi:O-6-methylguanine DNA methyltransferase
VSHSGPRPASPLSPQPASRPPPRQRAPRSQSPFARAVLREVARIPKGRVATYGGLAERVGRPGAARAVGSVVAAADADGLPYHRVVGADGRVGGTACRHLGAGERARRLRAEGVRVAADGRIAGFARLRWA